VFYYGILHFLKLILSLELKRCWK